MSIMPGIMDGWQFHLAGKRNRGLEPGTLDRETTSLIWKTPSVIDFDAARGDGWVAISLGRKTEPMTGNRNPWPWEDFAYLRKTGDD